MELCLQYIAPIDQRDHKLYVQLAAWTHLLKLKVHNLYIPLYNVSRLLVY